MVTRSSNANSIVGAGSAAVADITGRTHIKTGHLFIPTPI
jgi:hypothetical protein